ncbi:hypothetical protein C7212DRAFT_341374 [Tuber magnatum]|uniref:Uncharacterized protein n=1 Tax=Tuber magnatum TaxID=42249 RepID=A0A317SVW3_9PEZI|nr:hypothetical protein C7212DRAFT_341374 [Tuber magnatum]
MIALLRLLELLLFARCKSRFASVRLSSSRTGSRQSSGSRHQPSLIEPLASQLPGAEAVSTIEMVTPRTQVSGKYQVWWAARPIINHVLIVALTPAYYSTEENAQWVSYSRNGALLDSQFGW